MSFFLFQDTIQDPTLAFSVYVSLDTSHLWEGPHLDLLDVSSWLDQGYGLEKEHNRDDVSFSGHMSGDICR
jgi:hypothetical protein